MPRSDLILVLGEIWYWDTKSLKLIILCIDTYWYFLPLRYCPVPNTCLKENGTISIPDLPEALQNCGVAFSHVEGAEFEEVGSKTTEVKIVFNNPQSPDVHTSKIFEDIYSQLSIWQKRNFEHNRHCCNRSFLNNCSLSHHLPARLLLAKRADGEGRRGAGEAGQQDLWTLLHWRWAAHRPRDCWGRGCQSLLWVKSTTRISWLVWVKLRIKPTTQWVLPTSVDVLVKSTFMFFPRNHFVRIRN